MSNFLIILAGLFVITIVLGMACIFVIWVAERVLK